MRHLPFARIYGGAVTAALAVLGVLALLERNPQATATLVVSGVLMVVALAHAAAMTRRPKGAVSFMHHLSGAALAVAVAATSFAAAYLLNKDVVTSNLFAMSLALVHLAVSVTMLLTHLGGAYADLYLMQTEHEEELAAAPGEPTAPAPQAIRRPVVRSGGSLPAGSGLPLRWRVRYAASGAIGQTARKET